jgi:hypothetical protein
LRVPPATRVCEAGTERRWPSRISAKPFGRAVGYRVGVKYLHLGWDFQSTLAERRTGDLSILEWLRSLAGVRKRRPVVRGRRF